MLYEADGVFDSQIRRHWFIVVFFHLLLSSESFPYDSAVYIFES